MEIWCNEAQERFVLAVAPAQLMEFERICKRERCPFAVIGEATGERMLVVKDSHFDSQPVDVSMQILLGKPPKMLRDVQRIKPAPSRFDASKLDLQDAAMRVLRLPAVADKSFLVTIGDRSV